MSTLTLASFALMFTLGSPAPDHLPPRPGIHFIDVGQGAAALILGRDAVVLVDAGPASGAEAITAALVARGLSHIDLVIATHFDADHIGGLGPVLIGPDGRRGTADDVSVGAVWDRGLAAPVPETEVFALYLVALDGHRIAPAPGARFEASGLSVEVIALPGPEPAVPPIENDRGLVVCVDVGDLRALLPGDAAGPRVAAAAAACGPLDLLWASHHGAANGSSAQAIAQADPGLTVISAGHRNGYCHPSPSTLAWLGDRPALILDGAGVWPSESCASLAPTLGPAQVVVGGDVWVGAALDTWIGLGGQWRRWGGGGRATDD